MNSVERRAAEMSADPALTILFRVGSPLCVEGVARSGASLAGRRRSGAHGACRSRLGHSMRQQRSNLPLQLTRAAGLNEQREAAGSGPRS